MEAKRSRSARPKSTDVSRLLAYGFGLGLVALTASPVLRSPDEDSYPLSTYPMFARERGQPWLEFLEGVDARGKTVHLGPEFLGSDEVMQAAATVRAAVASGPEGLGALCPRVAERVADEPALRDVVAVRIVGARFDPLRYFVEGPAPEGKVVYMECPCVRKP